MVILPRIVSRCSTSGVIQELALLNFRGDLGVGFAQKFRGDLWVGVT